MLETEVNFGINFDDLSQNQIAALVPVEFLLNYPDKLVLAYSLALWREPSIFNDLIQYVTKNKP